MAGANVDDGAQRVWLSYAELASLYALAEANRRLMRKQNRSVRGHDHPLRKTDKMEWHTVLPAADNVDELLAGSLDLFTATAGPADSEKAQCLRQTVHDYLRELLTTRVPHDPDALAGALADAGCWDEQPPGQRRPIE